MPERYLLLKDIPVEVPVSETQIRKALKQKKYSPIWVMLKFMDCATALISVRTPRKSKNSDFTINIKGRTVKAIRLTEAEEDEFELMLNSVTMEMFSSSSKLKKAVESTIKQMMQVENKNLFKGKKGDIKYDLQAATSRDYQVYPFGSRVMGLGLNSSDYDVFIDMENYYQGGGETHTENSVQLISDYLRHTKAFSDFILIPRARVPVLKVTHRGTGIQCDISTTNGIGVENTKLLRGYLSDRRVRFVASAVKLWARKLGLTQTAMGPGALTSYCMLWLLMFALMQDDPAAVVPVARAKQEYQGPKLYVDGWDCSFCSSELPKTKNTKNEFELLHYFFNFYGNMSFNEITDNVICPFLGTMIPVKQFVKTKSLPNEFKNYKKQVAFNRFYEMRCNAVMCVQDPIEQGHNIAKAVDDWALDRFLKLCQTTAEVMESNMLQELHYIRPSSSGGLGVKGKSNFLGEEESSINNKEP